MFKSTKYKSMITRILLTLILIVATCKDLTQTNIDYRLEMRDFVIAISKEAKSQDSDFFIIPQNGHELLSSSGSFDGEVNQLYLDAIDGVGQENLFYGYKGDNVPTSSEDVSYLTGFIEIAHNAEKVVFITDYISVPSSIDLAYAKNKARDYVSFSADERDLNTIPEFPKPIPNLNVDNISNLKEVQNFLYLINPGKFSSRDDFIKTLSQTNYDMLIVDAFYGSEILTAAEVTQLKTKANGGRRLVISYMSIGEAEDYRFYWKDGWNNVKPFFLEEENPEWKGNYKVKYWDKNWQAIILGNEESYLQRILKSDFDGVYLDIIDGFWYFENKERERNQL